MMTPSISIAMCTFNGERYLSEQLASIAAQSRPPYELVVCDDGSSDGTLRILAAFAEGCVFPVRVVENEQNLHFTGNFLKAASLCSGSYVAFCDQDDVWRTDKLEKILSSIRDGGPVLVLHEGHVIDAAGKSLKMKLPDLDDLEADPDRPPFSQGAKGFAMTVHRSILTEILMDWNWDRYLEFVRRFGAPFGHDLLVYSWCLDRDIVFIKESLVAYRVHDTNVTASPASTKSGVGKLWSVLRQTRFADFNYQEVSLSWRSQVALIDETFASQPRGLRLLRDYLNERSRLWGLRAAVHDRASSRRRRGKALASLWHANKDVRLAEPFNYIGLIKDVFLILVNPRRGVDSTEL